MMRKWLTRILILIATLAFALVLNLSMLHYDNYFFPSFNNATGTTAGISNYPAGFWHGMWHGLIAVFTLMASLFSDKISMYEIHNNGCWYNYGFFLGIATVVIFSRSRVKINVDLNKSTTI